MELLTGRTLLATAKKMGVKENPILSDFLCKTLYLSKDELDLKLKDKSLDYESEYIYKHTKIAPRYFASLKDHRFDKATDRDILETGTAEEIAGYYIHYYSGASTEYSKKTVIREWMTNLMSSDHTPSDKDAEVSCVLENAYDVIIVKDIVWDKTDEEYYLSDWGIIPRPDNYDTISPVELEDIIIEKLADSNALHIGAKEFSYMNPIDHRPMHYRKGDILRGMNPIPLTAEEVECFYHTYNMYVVWTSDNTRSALQTAGCTMETALNMLRNGIGSIYYEGCNHQNDSGYITALEEFRCNKSQEWIIGISGSEINDIKLIKTNGTISQVKRYMADLVQDDRNKDPELWVNGTKTAEDVIVNSDGNLSAYGQYADYDMTYTANLLNKMNSVNIVKTENL